MLEGKTILVAEDETLIAMVLEDMLAEFGCTLAGSAHSVSAALDVAATASIDAAILDIELSDGKSWPIADVLQSRRIPFAFSTGHGHDAEIDTRFATAPILAKPFDGTELQRILEELLGNGSTSV
jgi:CheY-like chemotaxis protein